MSTLLEQAGVRVLLVTVDHDEVGAYRLGAEGVEDGLALELADLLVVVADVGVGTDDGAVVRDDLDALLVCVGNPRGGLLGVDRGDRDDLDAVGYLLLELLLLLADITGRVVVDNLAVRAVLLDRFDEQRLVQRLVASGLVLREQQTDLGLAARVRRALLVVARLATGCEGDGHRNCGRAYDDASRHCVHCGCASLTRPQRCGRGGWKSTRPRSRRQGVNP